MDTLTNMWNWLWGTSGTSSGSILSGNGTSSNGSGSPVFSYVLIGAVVLLIVAVIFGELERA